MENMRYFVIVTDINNEGAAVDTKVMRMNEKMFEMCRSMYDTGRLDKINHSYAFITPETPIIDWTRGSQN